MTNPQQEGMNSRIFRAHKSEINSLADFPSGRSLFIDFLGMLP
jgi:hypothetical protein